MNNRYGTKTNIIKGLEEVINYQFETYNIDPDFPQNIGSLFENDFSVEPCSDRIDFRGDPVLTIDCADCKDMDDAVSLQKTPSGYRLSVHIADVASYISLGSDLDDIATYRATSIYLPGLTVPMLPSVLSNNLCSLNPGVDRLTLSVIMDIDNNGNILSSNITKGLICSRVKGIYTEVNKLISGSNDEKLRSKYSEVIPELLEMARLYKILRSKRVERGATVTDTNKPKITIEKHNVFLAPRADGIAENMIEEFMILANSVVAEFLYNNDLPAIFRVQEKKNNMAAYQPIKEHHAELALESYSHFTSPIRRISDLKVHQIISLHIKGVAKQEIRDLFDEHLIEVCERATKRSRTAKQVQEKCERYCYEQFFKLHRNYTYTGMLVGFDRKNRAIVQINKYNIKIIGYALISGKIGSRYSFEVGISNNNSEFVATRIHKLSA